MRGTTFVKQMRPNVRRTKKSRNAVRADRVEEALRSYRVTGLRESHTSLRTTISDLLTDLRHWADRQELDLARLDQEAHLNDLAELTRR